LTLIELIVVVVIIAILTTIIYMTVQFHINNAKKSRLLADIDTMSKAIDSAITAGDLKEAPRLKS